MHSTQLKDGRSGSAKTVVVAVLALLAIVFSVLNLLRHQKSMENPREHIEMAFLCPECGELISMTITEMHARMREGSKDIVMTENDVSLRCPKCGKMARLARECPSCEKHFILPPPGQPMICPHCGQEYGAGMR